MKKCCFSSRILHTERYFINSLGEFKYVNVELDKESWDEMFHDFFEAMDNAVTEVTCYGGQK